MVNMSISTQIFCCPKAERSNYAWKQCWKSSFLPLVMRSIFTVFVLILSLSKKAYNIVTALGLCGAVLLKIIRQAALTG